MAMVSRTSAANAVEGSVVAADGYRAVEIWLWCIAALVFTMIVVGGATRLTDSGLSITEWKPILGAIPPLNAADWQVAFEKYKQIPEYHMVNKGMGLEEFKFIFWWEWSHRFLGRIIGHTEKQWTAAAWILERRWPERWAKREPTMTESTAETITAQMLDANRRIAEAGGA